MIITRSSDDTYQVFLELLVKHVQVPQYEDADILNESGMNHGS